MDFQWLQAPLHQQWVKHLKYFKICLWYQIPYFKWLPSLIQDGCHLWDPTWPIMLPATLMQILSFPNFLSFPMFGSPNPPSTLHISCTWLTCVYVTHVYAHCPLHLPKKVTKKLSINHIGSSTSHQPENTKITQTCDHMANYQKLIYSKCYSPKFTQIIHCYPLAC